MIIAIDIDNTCIKSKSWVHKVINIKPDLISFGRKKTYKLNKNKKANPTVLNKFLGVLNNKKYYAVKDAVEVINKLGKNNIIYLLSSRPSWLKSVKELTIQNIKSSGINCDAIFLNCSNKDEFCQNYHVDMFIDNSFSQCSAVANNSETKTLCIVKNCKNDIINGVKCMQNWQNVYSYAQLVSLQAIENKSYLSEEYKQKLKNQFAEYNFLLNDYLTFDYKKITNTAKLIKELQIGSELFYNKH